MREGVQITICDPPLPAADKIYPGGVFQWSDELFAIGRPEIAGMQQDDVLYAGIFPNGVDILLIETCTVARGRRNYHNVRLLFSTSQLGEFIPDGGGRADIAADDQQRPMFGTVPGRGGVYREWTGLTKRSMAQGHA